MWPSVQAGRSRTTARGCCRGGGGDGGGGDADEELSRGDSPRGDSPRGVSGMTSTVSRPLFLLSSGLRTHIALDVAAALSMVIATSSTEGSVWTGVTESTEETLDVNPCMHGVVLSRGASGERGLSHDATRASRVWFKRCMRASMVKNEL